MGGIFLLCVFETSRAVLLIFLLLLRFACITNRFPFSSSFFIFQVIIIYLYLDSRWSKETLLSSYLLYDIGDHHGNLNFVNWYANLPHCFCVVPTIYRELCLLRTLPWRISCNCSYFWLLFIMWSRNCSCLLFVLIFQDLRFFIESF